MTFNTDGSIGCTSEDIKDNNKVIVRTRGDKVFKYSIFVSFILCSYFCFPVEISLFLSGFVAFEECKR